MTFFQTARLFLFVALFFCGFMISVFAGKPSTPPEICYCPADKSIPLYEQSASDSQLTTWAIEAAIDAYSFDYLNYRKQLQNASRYFTPVGWKRFILGLEKSKNLETIQDKKLVGTAIPTDKPLIRAKGLAEGIFTWRVEIPMLVIYESKDTKIKQNVLVSMFIKRTTGYVGFNNLGIVEFNVTSVPSKIS